MKNLLIITPRYPHRHDEISEVFVHSHVEIFKEFFDKIVVISLTPQTPRLISYFMDPSRRLDSLAENYSYDNVEVHYTKQLYFPFKIGFWRRGKQCYDKSIRILENINFKPDAVLAHFTWPSGYVASFLKKEYGVPTVLYIHENFSWLKEEIENPICNQIWRDMDALIRVNSSDVPLLRKFNPYVQTIAGGYDLDKYSSVSKSEARERLGISANEKIVFSIGHLIERKGFDLLIQAANQLHSQRKDFKLFIAGNGPLMKKLQSLIEKSDSDIKLLGYITAEEVILWMTATDVFALTSHSEGNPSVIFEALGSGTPVVSTKVGGIPEVINKDEYGILTDSNPLSISYGLQESLTRSWDSHIIREYAKQYSWRRVVEEMMKILQRINLNGGSIQVNK